MSIRLTVAFVCGLACVALCAATEPVRPLEQVRSTTDRILGILKDAKLQGDEKQPERRRLLREELEQRFDWNAICRSCLGRHWPKLSREQQQQFIDLFKQFLERTYLDRIEPYYGELLRIEYQGEKIVENNFASVRTVVVTKQNIEHPVEYRLQKNSAGAWQVYDAIIEGVSLVKNYRTQFDEILTRSSFEGLIKDLKAKIAAGPAPAPTPTPAP
jgi:phospholipid transport system substrate-binding protein